ncbi:hypothetical protein GCM10027176_82150 [Actinoallomurus bryophytorum]|uniref:Type VII secretion system (Wss) protein ESAT-6 n=1 Tax=Actinoallomurus bryophytorum TaxID=1490222 RepID=A0A543CC60_9ACTN|nr:hypothetical protein [Actinoallomurus bryophytorum]TQL94666.1 hypothetical protein FB559_0147 [Actinoallomurus bryophytorum]
MSTYPPSPGTLRSPSDPPPAGDTQRPNPEYADLYQAYQRAFESAHTLEKALDPPVRTAGDAWVGPAARGWQNDLETQRGELKKAATQILWDIYGALSKVPPFIPK